MTLAGRGFSYPPPGAYDALIYKGAIDCSANPNYPAADAGHMYKVSVGGKIGGASGAVVTAGDTIICTVDGSAAGTQAAVGANWDILQTNIDLTAPGAIGGTTAGTLRSLIDEETEASSDTLTANQCSGGLISNVGQGAADCNYTLPTIAAGYHGIVHAGEPSANYLRLTAPAAGTMVVDGVPNMTYASLATPAKDNFFTFFSALSAPGSEGILTGAALAQGSTTTAVANGAFTFYIAGIKYADAADAVGVAPGNDVIPQSKYGCVAFDIGTDGTLDAIEASDNATGYDTAELAVAGLPAVAASHVRTGYVTAIDTGDTFIFGTDDLATAGTITVAFTSTAAYTAVFNWIVTTGAGTVTSG